MKNKTEIWSSVHTNYDVFRERLLYTDSSFASDIGWMHYLIDKSPNGALFKKNILYDALKNKKIYLAHITKNYSGIIRDGKLFSSSGCLVGSVYCTPIIKTKRGFRLHNLGEYIYFKEAPMFSRDKDDIGLLFIEIDSSSFPANNIVGVDYLKLGRIHFSNFLELSYLLSQEELAKLKNFVVRCIYKSSKLLSIVSEFSSEKILSNFEKFYKLYRQTISELPILGYILFETLCEYISLFQVGSRVEYYRSQNELYSPNFKNLVFGLYPDLTRSFNLGMFSPNFKSIVKYLKGISIKTDICSLEEYLVRRLRYLIISRFYNDVDFNIKNNVMGPFWENAQWNFEYLQRGVLPLMGHTIHRFLRNMHRYPDFYFYFDQYKALKIWNYWNHNNIIFPYNAILPKGEVGINPAYPYLKYRIFKGRVQKEKGLSYVVPEKRINVKIKPRLAELNMLLMRRK